MSALEPVSVPLGTHVAAATVSGVPTAKVVDNKGPLSGKRFVFTGVLAGLTWDEAEERVKSHGGKVLKEGVEVRRGGGGGGRFGRLDKR